MYTIKEASEMLGVARSTLRRWEGDGKITSYKTKREDILSIITVFSSRLYGSRSHRKKKIEEKIKELLTEE